MHAMGLIIQLEVVQGVVEEIDWECGENSQQNTKRQTRCLRYLVTANWEECQREPRQWNIKAVAKQEGNGQYVRID